MRSLSETLADLHAAGATLSLRGGKLKADFGDAEVQSSLLSDLRSHADTLRAYLPTLEPDPSGRAPEIEVQVGSKVVRFTEWTPELGPMAGSEIVIDTETEMRPDDLIVPRLVLATAYDGKRGHLIHADNAIPFLRANSHATFIAHNASFDLAVIDAHGGAPDQAGLIWQLVDENRVACSQELERLIMLARDGGTPPFGVSLRECAIKHLQIEIEKEAPAIDGAPIRESFGQYLGATIAEIPPAFLSYAAADAVATLLVWKHQRAEIYKIRSAIAPLCFGFVDADQLSEAWHRFGPLSLHVQVKASIICDRLKRIGVKIDRDKCRAAIRSCEAIRDAEAEQLRSAGLFVPKGEGKTPKGEKPLRTAMKELIVEQEKKLLDDGTLDEPLPRTATGAISMKAEHHQLIADKCGHQLIEHFAKYERAKKFAGDFLHKLDRETVHATFKNLKSTGRLSCANPNLQQIPKCGKADLKIEPTCRQVIVPHPGKVFAVVDVRQLEGRSLAAFWKYQVGFGDEFAAIVERGHDIHSSLARELHGREPTKDERSQVKCLTFGAPAGMGPATMIANAQKSGVVLTEEQVQSTIDAYHRMAPELEQHLSRTRDVGHAAKSILDVRSRGVAWDILSMLAGDEVEDLDDETRAEYWELAQQFQPLLPDRTAADKKLREHLRDGRPSLALATAVRRYLTNEGVIVQSGRIRNFTKFTESRNGVFQGNGADAVILATWDLIRAGFDVRMVIHDEVVVEVDDDHDRDRKLKQIDDIMCRSITEALGGIPTEVEGMLSRSWSHLDKIDEPAPEPPRRRGVRGRVGSDKPAGNRGVRGTIGAREKPFDIGPLPF